MDKNGIRELFVHAFKGTSPDVTQYSVKDVKETLSDEIHALAHDFNSYRRNKLDLFEIIQEAYDEIIPEYIGNFVSSFAEVKTVPDGQKASFRVLRGRRRAKTFVTEVGLSGVYEAFRLDHDTFEVSGKAIGGTAIIDFERSIIGAEDITESTNVLLEGIEEGIYKQILMALLATVLGGDMPANNKVESDGFDSEAMQKLCNIARSYGGGSAVIFATPEFVAKMGPDAIGMPVYGARREGVKMIPTMPTEAGYATPMYSPRDIQDISATGYITIFRGTPIVQLPQSFYDENNDLYQIPSSLAYIFPAGSEKIVKVVLEGPTRIDDFKSRDRTYEVEAYKKVGVAILSSNNWCVYRNRELETEEYAITDEMKAVFTRNGETWGAWFDRSKPLKGNDDRIPLTGVGKQDKDEIKGKTGEKEEESE